MDYFFQEQRWTDTFLSLHVKKFKRIILFLLIAFSAAGAKAQSDVKFNDYVRYSQWVIDSRLSDFYGNRKKFGFNTYDSNLNSKNTVSTWYKEDGTNYSIQVDYVAGLVAKATIEAAEYYKNFDWSKPWFKSVEWYGNKCSVPTSPDNLDAINASKMYFGIYALANGSFSSNAESTTASKATTQLGNALSALKHYNETYAFPASTTLNGKDIAGGWYHKSSYLRQMWLDGQYMGPALLAQLINGYSSYAANKVPNDWDLITKQFKIVWEQCWDSNEKLLYHAFSSKQLGYWTSDAEIWTKAQKTLTNWTKMTAPGHSAAFWGRAEGWYFLALVDVLEQMQKAGLNKSTNDNYSCYTTLKGYLDDLALGIAKRQDATSGCWYQLIGKNGEYSARYYNGKDKGEIKNYLESSCTAIFATAFLKATRLGLLSSATDGTTTYNYKDIGINAYKGTVTQFMKQRTDGTVDLLGCCKSAGLGTAALGNDRFRDGSNAYYLHGHDVAPTSTTSNYYTEGKVLGAFIMAATEYERLYQPSTLLSKDLNKTYNLGSNESLTVEVLGDGTPKYQWYNATESTPSVISGANDASYTPTQNGKYYCEIKVTPKSGAAKTRTTSTSDSYTFKTSTAEVTVAAATTYTVTFNAGSNGTCSQSPMKVSAGANITLPSVRANSGYTFDGWWTAETGGTKVDNPYTPTDDITLYAQYKSTVSTSVVATFENPTQKKWTATENKDFTITGVSGIKEDKSAKLSSGGSIILKIPEGYTVTGFDFTLLCTNTSKGSTLSVGDDKIYVKDGEHTSHKMNLLSSVTGPTTLTITNSGGKELNIQSIKVYGSNAKSISFTTHPLDAEYVKDATSVKALTVAAKVNNVTGDTPSISYHWFWNNTKSTDGGTALNVQESSTSWTPDVSTPGTKYYYCMATATVGEEQLEAYSNIATVTVSDPAITIVKQPVGATYGLNQTTGVEPLTVVATTNTGSTDFTYQWYSKDTESVESGTKIENATSAEYRPPVDQVGTKYYYCEVKSGSLTKNTNIVAITVNNNQPTYVYKVTAGLDAPAINSSKYITTTEDKTGETGTKLVKMTFGGWRWNGGTYTRPENKKDVTDSWTASETADANVVAALDGFEYWFRGTQDAKHEKKDSVSWMYGQNRYGWFVSPTRENGITTDSHPYTLPVRGSFMTFEPTMNGTLTIYILQNGVWNSDTKNHIDIIPGEFRMHAFQITNQRGLVLAEFAPKYSVTNNQRVNPDYSCSQYLTKPKTFNNQSKDVSDWEEFWTLSDKERQAVHDSWSDPKNGGCQKIIKLDNGSFLAIQKAVVKYQFHVTGNETYYFFSNFSKMGFSGATFQPDAEQPTATPAEGKISKLELSDVTAYNEITATETGKNIEGTDLKEYTYKIGGTEIAPVAGVTIPQFYSIKLNRTFKPNQWTTLSLPFNLTQTEVEQIFGKGTQIIVFEKAKITSARTYLTFFYHEIQNVLPGYPYLIRPTLVDAKGNKMVSKSESADNTPTYTIDGDYLTEFTVYNKAINPFIKQHEFKSGGYTAKCTPSYCTANENGNYSKRYEEGDIFVSEGDGTVYISGGQSYGKGYRSYIDYTGTTAPAKALSISFSGVEDGDDNGTTTEIRVTELADDVIETLGIGGVYNLNGQKVADTTRNLPAGIYIVNGRKVVVK